MVQKIREIEVPHQNQDQRKVEEIHHENQIKFV